MKQNEQKEEGLICNLILKPKAGETTHEEMIEWIMMNMLVSGTSISKLYKTLIPKNFWEEWYKHHSDKSFFGDLVGYMSRDNVVIVPIEVNDAKTLSVLLENVKSIVGPSAKAPGPFRKKFAINTTYNAIHRPDCDSSAHSEESRLRPFKVPENLMQFKFIEVRKIQTQV